MTSPASNSTDRRWPEGGPTRVPFWVYTDPEIYKREQERIFAGRTWSYVALEAEIPGPGDFITTAVGDMPVVIVRDGDGKVNALVNRCAHRGVAFCRNDRGNARAFTCPYHQWTYDLQGKLTGVPFRHGYQGRGGMSADFKLDEHDLQPLKVAVRNGAVFASFDHAVEPFEDYLGPKMLAYFDRVFDGRKLALLGYMRQRIPCNWKLMVENLKDPYHASVLHVFLITFGLFRLDQESAVEMDETGRHGALISRRGPQVLNDATKVMSNFRADLKLQDPRLLEPMPEFPGPATVVMQTLWPNVIVQQQSNTLAMRQIVPRGPSHFDLNWTFFGYADDTPELRRRRIRQANLMGPAGLVSIDDSEVIEMSQLGAGPYPDAQAIVEMGGRGVADADTMVTEAGVRGLYRHYIEVMGL
ncbi:MAG TPA: aromatic ring-hydroxylating dioxygenase subunit alpha [Stellaceae bacterium]|nr:aromatic ring-hydroxylating dioxygenase subunit alpha [Stellaceae bacterium]